MDLGYWMVSVPGMGKWTSGTGWSVFLGWASGPRVLDGLCSWDGQVDLGGEILSVHRT